ncbi:hypothetical protein PBI_LUCKY2013_204 [Mycobacterium phage Lucky2013]|uniref:Uncharacterized protein n=1 Tax=Acinetobacter baumannii TaxID=470 RepID=A0AAJ0QTG9_ACIBA|nr:hypothetical protein [Acinetobacter baumannii]ASD50865.1 hypothetical protein PORCELAIN_207 [Mycobacterium phage Porcelain]ASD53595.1 hypothetical protein PBI_LUCKY2013_204 [Mycobacterium phage Lucky2013]ATN89011.1 hypothetical protein SEA_DMPSTRDIVER_206 [Mycobacterium phage DmpstrDiver]QQM15351.1 hypothetical protein SEA_POUND_196 [Mycobacterium phage Pound]KZA06975.1 hypothetical protein LV35_04232 [Acinetobacter baumannii]
MNPDYQDFYAEMGADLAMEEFDASSGYGVYRNGWNEALEALEDRLRSAEETLSEMAEQKRDVDGSDYDRLRGKRAGVLLALDFVRGMKR